MQPLNGIHHITAITGDAAGNVAFYTNVLGLRLVKKTVNQDDVSAYHLFYGDKTGSPGTEITFFDWPRAGQNIPGVDSINRISLRVNGRTALEYWAERLTEHGVSHKGIEVVAGRESILFTDPEGQRLAIVDDGGAVYEGEPWARSPVPTEYAIRGVLAVTLSVPSFDYVDVLLTRVMGYKLTGTTTNPDDANEELRIYSVGAGGPGRELHVVAQPSKYPARPGFGGVHHVAFRVADDEQQLAWRKHLSASGVRVSEVIDRFYFHSIYYRITQGILFEIATDGPGFTTDEDLETLGEELALPPFLEPHRERIEAGLTPISVETA